jgi:hypothetical protein
MKADFRNIDSRINVGAFFYLYGNYKKTFEPFCDFVKDKLREKSLEPKIYFCSVAECLKIINGQCDLFETGADCFCVRNIEDNHMESVAKFFNEKNRVFILESGNYLKCKKITDYLLKSEALAIASFNNETTIRSFVGMLFPNVSPSAQNEIVKIISNTDEELYSLLRKISLLENAEDLKNYSTFKRSFLDGLDVIPLIRFLLQTTIKERISKTPNFLKINVQSENAVQNLLKAELAQKFGPEISKGYVYGRIASI